MTKAEIIDLVAIRTGEKRKAVTAILEEIFSVIQESDKAVFKGFGIFEWITKQERPGRNPQTGEKLLIPAKEKLVFRMSK